MIPYARQDISQADIDTVVEVLRSDFLTQGPAVPRFEQAVAERVGAHHAVAVNSGTSALHLACLALDVGPGDQVWTSPNTFVASANCARYCGATVDFVDIDPRTYNLCPDALRDKLQSAERSGTLPKVVIPVHFAGQPSDMPQIHALSQRYGFHVIEDASHAIGAIDQGQPVGACRHSDITVFSFHPVKLITTGEGGMALTSRADLARRMAHLRSHGIVRDPADMTWPAEGAWYYEQIELGYNYRITDIQAVLGLSQLQRLDEFIARRHALAARYDAALADLPVQLPTHVPDSVSAMHLYPIQVTEHDRAQVFSDMRAAGIGVNVHYIPVHTQPDYQRLGFRVGECPTAEVYYRRAISLPLYPAMTDVQQDEVIGALIGALP
jgi:UDP-4-amino-4,6-dideoxy-N-acetyl-beta-L-altrosamine transaminase